jgi:signal transduction histidine kinase
LFKVGSYVIENGTENEKGTGLGLILCKEFVTNNGGTLSIESKPGKGSKFIFTVPLYDNSL